MQLSDREIHGLLQDGHLIIVGPKTAHRFDAACQVRPASIDLRVDARITTLYFSGQYLDVRELDRIEGLATTRLLNDGEPIMIPARGIVYGQIYEQLRLPEDVAGRIEGRSRVARMGIAVHSTGDFINPGFEGAMPLQLINYNQFPIMLFPYMEICQLVLYRLSSRPLIPYGERSDTRYHGQAQAGPSVLYEDSVLRAEGYDTIEQAAERRLVENYRRNRLEEQRRIEERKAALANTQLAPGLSFSGSTIGTVNINSIVQRIDTNITTLGTQENAGPIKQALDELLEAFQANRSAFREDDYVNAIEQLEEVSEQASLPPDQPKKRAVIKACLDNIGRTAATAEAVHGAYQKWAPVITSFFNQAGGA